MIAGKVYTIGTVATAENGNGSIYVNVRYTPTDAGQTFPLNWWCFERSDGSRFALNPAHVEYIGESL